MQNKTDWKAMYDSLMMILQNMAGQIPDTAAVFNSFMSKSMHINQLLLAKAERLDCEDSVKLSKVISQQN